MQVILEHRSHDRGVCPPRYTRARNVDGHLSESLFSLHKRRSPSMRLRPGAPRWAQTATVYPHLERKRQTETGLIVVTSKILRDANAVAASGTRNLPPSDAPRDDLVRQPAPRTNTKKASQGGPPPPHPMGPSREANSRQDGLGYPLPRHWRSKQTPLLARTDNSLCTAPAQLRIQRSERASRRPLLLFKLPATDHFSGTL